MSNFSCLRERTLSSAGFVILRACFLALVASFLVSTPLPAQSGTATVEGRVFNQVSGRYVANARVSVVGGTHSVLSNEYGDYRLTGLPAGEVTLQVTYTGLDTRTTTVTLQAGGVVTRDVTLTDSSLTGDDETIVLDVFTVQSVRETNAANIAANEQRNSVNLKNAVAADAFGDVTEGNVGEFMKYLPETVIVTLTASLFIALVINPVLCSTLMRVKRTDGDLDELSVITGSKFMGRYRVMMEWVMNHRAIVLSGTVAMFFAILFLYGATTLRTKGTEFFPTAEPNWASVSVKTPVGTTIDVSDQYVREVEHIVNKHSDAFTSTVSNVGQYRGLGGGESSSATSHLSYVQVDFPKWQDWKVKPSEMIKTLRQDLSRIAGAEIKVEKEQRGPPTGAPVNVEIHGEDFGELVSLSDKLQHEIREIPGLVNLTDDFDRSRPELRVLIDRDKASRAGLTASDIADAVRTAFNGRDVSRYREGKDEYYITVRLDERFRQSPRDLERLYVAPAGGSPVTLGSVATITTAPAIGSIKHVKLNRVITVSADAAEGYSGQQLLRQVQAKLKDFAVPPGYQLKYTGENEDSAEAQGFLGEAFLIALFLIFLVLVLQFNSIAVPFIIMSTVILSLMGVFIGLMLHQRPFTIVMTGIGVISLAGVVVNNAIVLIDFIQQLRARGFPRREAVIISSMVRLRPVMLTAGTTVIGLLPIALGLDINFYHFPPVAFGSEGGSFWLPMAVATIYGLSLATVLTLVVVPTLYDTIEGGKERIAAWFSRTPAEPQVEPTPEAQQPVKVPA